MCKLSSASILLLFLAAGKLLSLDVPTRKIEDDSSLRISLEASWFRETPGSVLIKRPETHTLRGGSRVQVRVETSARNRDEFAVVFAREQNGEYPGWAQGSWVYSRRRDNNPAGSRIRVFLRSDYNTYVQFRPYTDEKSCMDVVLYNAYMIRSLPIPIPFERLLVLPVEEALAAAGDRFPRRYFDPDPGQYRDTRAFVAAVRARLPELSFVDDGAVNENGEYVFIETLEAQNAEDRQTGGLNCSGFAKWVVDGVLRPLTGQRLPVALLKEPFGDRGSSGVKAWEESRDPFFGLDWCRNLASAAGQILRSPGFGSLDEIEVRDWPFSQVIIRENSPRGPLSVSPGVNGSAGQPGAASVHAFPGYLRNAGFGFEGLHPLLYALAVDEPNRVYLAAVNNEIGAPVTQDNPRGLPRIRQYYHIAVLVPFFAANGTFQVAVFESAAETSFSGFKTRYPGEFVNLTRVPIEGRFDP